MGIVVTLVMLLGLCLLLPSPVSIFRKSSSDNYKIRSIVAGLLLVAGMWNAFWHGLRHLGEFWGQAALVSGLIMIVSALLIFIARRESSELMYRWFHGVLIIGLLASFLLYAVTLVQLNLGSL